LQKIPAPYFTATTSNFTSKIDGESATGSIITGLDYARSAEKSLKDYSFKRRSKMRKKANGGDNKYSHQNQNNVTVYFAKISGRLNRAVSVSAKTARTLLP